MIENLNPEQSWNFMQQSKSAVMIDVRTGIEYSFVGHPPQAIHVAWKEFPDMKLNPQFVSQVEAIVTNKDTPVLLLCRSGQRSLAAANALQEAGFNHLINIVEGFEGALDKDNHRGNIDGWKFRDLPWTQS